MRATLPFEVLRSIRIATWRALFAAVGAPPGISSSSASHEAVAAALHAGDLPVALARAVFTISAFATEAGRVDIFNAAAAFGSAGEVPEATSPADLVALLLAAAPRDAAVRALLEAAKALRDRTFRPRLTLVFLGKEGVDPEVFEPTQYVEAIAKGVAAWGRPRGFGANVTVAVHRAAKALVYEIVHDGRAESLVLEEEVTVARPRRSHEVVYTKQRRGLAITTDCAEVVAPLAALMGTVLFGDARHFVERAAVDLWVLQQRGEAALAARALAGKARATAIAGTWHSGKDHSITPRGQDLFRALRRYKIRIEGGRLDAVTLRAEILRPERHGPKQCDVALRPPHQLSISEPELAPLIEELLDEASITNPKPRVRDFFGQQPWIGSAAFWIENEGDDGFRSLVKRRLLVPDRSNRAVSPPGQPFGDRTATAFPLSRSKFLAVSPDPTVPPFLVEEKDLVVYALSFERLGAAIAEELGLEGPATSLDDDGVLRCGRRALGPAELVLYLLTRPVRAATEKRLLEEAEHGHAILVLPEARMRQNVLRQIAMPRLGAPFRPMLGAVARALKIEAQVETPLYAPEGTRVVVHRATLRLWIDGLLCEYATEAHVRLLEYLIEREGQQVHTKDIAEHVARGHQHEDTTRRAIESFFLAVEKSFEKRKKRAPKDLRALIAMPRHGRYVLGATGFVD